MLPRRKRVDKGLFLLVFKKGRAFHSPHLSLKVLETKKEGRFSVVAGKNASKSAAARNRMRRKGYALLKKHLPLLFQNAACVLFIKKPISPALFEEELKHLIECAAP